MRTFSPVATKKRECADFFLSSCILCISNNAVLSAFAGWSEYKSFIAQDKRGHHEPNHKLSGETYWNSGSHVESFPVMESHYCRVDTKKKYSEPGLNITKMYELLKQKREGQQLCLVKNSTYVRTDAYSAMSKI